jgi:hypothetical protein
VGIVDAVKGAFSFLSTRSQSEERVTEYLLREHRRGRAAAEVLEDPYVTNRLNEEQIRRILDRPEVIHALGDDLVAEARTSV